MFPLAFRRRPRQPSIRESLTRSHQLVVLLSFGVLFALALAQTLMSDADLPRLDPGFGERARSLGLSLAEGPSGELPADPSRIEASLQQFLSSGAGPGFAAGVGAGGLEATVQPAVEAVAVLDARGRVVAAGGEGIARGAGVETLEPQTWRGAISLALRGVEDLDEGRLVLKDADTRRALAAYPVKRRDGRVVGVVAVCSEREELLGGGGSLFLTLSSAAFGMLFFALLALPALLAGALASRVLAGRLAHRLSHLERATGAVADGKWDGLVPDQPPDEVGRLASHFNEMAARLDAAEKARREFTLNVCRELRTPVAVMQAHLETSGLLDRGDRAVETVYEETITLRRLIDDLSRLAERQASEAPLRIENVPLRPAVQGALEGVASLAWERQRVSVVVDVPGELAVLADATRLPQILRNLALNALRHTPEGGVVHVSAGARGDEVAVRVQDTGEGIPEEEQPLVFERRYQGRAGAGRGGSGLGLSIVKELVERQGGAISVESAPGQGARFTFTLPSAGGEHRGMLNTKGSEDTESGA